MDEVSERYYNMDGAADYLKMTIDGIRYHVKDTGKLKPIDIIGTAAKQRTPTFIFTETELKRFKDEQTARRGPRAAGAEEEDDQL